MRGIEQQFLSLQKGFHELIPANLLRPFDERELELLIGGICKIDTADWQANTRLKVNIIHCQIFSTCRADFFIFFLIECVFDRTALHSWHARRPVVLADCRIV